MAAEPITKAEQCAALLVDDLRAAIKAADPVAALLIEQHLLATCQLHNGLNRLQVALTHKQEN